MKTPEAIYNAFSILCFCIVFSIQSHSQITPWLNKSTHNEIPHVMLLSDNLKYILLADKSGSISVRDVETIKKIRSYDLIDNINSKSEELKTAFFEAESNNIICLITKSSDGKKGDSLIVKKINFHTYDIETLLTKPIKSNQFKFDIAPSKRRVLLLFGDKLEELDLYTQNVEEICEDACEAYYNEENQIQYNDRFKVKYDIAEDGNNLSSFIVGADSFIELNDHQNNNTYKVPFSKLDSLSDRITNENYRVKFYPSQFDESICLKFINKNYNQNGYSTHLFIIRSDSIIKYLKHTSFDTSSNAVWLAKRKLLFTNNIDEFIILEEGENTVDIKDEVTSFYPSISINDDFSKILYSSEGGSTFLFDPLNENIKNLIDEDYNRYLDFSNTDSYILVNKNGEKSGDVFSSNTEIEDLGTLSTNLDIVSINSFELSKRTNTVIYTFNVRYSRLKNETYKPDSLMFNTQGEIIGFYKDQIKHFDVEQNFIKTDTSEYISKINGQHILIQNLESGEKTVILTSGCDELTLKYSYDMQFISYACAESTYRSVNLFKNDYDKSNDCSLIHYADSAPLAFKSDFNIIKVWNSIELDSFLNLQINPGVLSNIQKAKFAVKKKTLYFLSESNLYSLNYNSFNLKSFPGQSGPIADFEISPDNKYIFIQATIKDGSNSDITSYLYSLETNTPRELRKSEVSIPNAVSSEGGIYKYIYFNKNQALCLSHNGSGEFELLSLDSESTNTICTIKLYKNGDWIVYTPEGYFDASEKGRQTLYYESQNEVLLYDQINQRYWYPDLLSKILDNPLNFRTQSIPEVPLYPKLSLSLKNKSDSISVNLSKRSGGIGNVSLYINGKEVDENINPNKLSSFSFSISDYNEYLFNSGLNIIGVKAFNSENWLASRINNIYIEPYISKAKSGGSNSQVYVSSRRRRRARETGSGIYGLFIGTSKYINNTINLDFADKDASDLKKAFDALSEDPIYDQERKKIFILTSDSKSLDSVPTKINILRAINYIQENANPIDLVVLF